MGRGGLAVALVLALAAVGCSSTESTVVDDTGAVSAPGASPVDTLADDTAGASTPESAPSVPAPTDDDTTATSTSVSSDTESAEPSSPSSDDGGLTGGAVRPSSALPIVSLIYDAEIATDFPDRDMGDLTRCVAHDLDPSIIAAIGPLDSDVEAAAVLASLDPALVEDVTAAMDACISPAVLLSFTWGPIEHDEHLPARCAIEQVGDAFTWADVVDADLGDEYLPYRLPFTDLDAIEAECFGLPGADESLSADEEALADELEVMGLVAGIELTSDEIDCVVVTSRGTLDLGSILDLESADVEVLDPLLDALDRCVPLAGVFAEIDAGSIVYSMCLDRALEGSIGWRELLELGARAEQLDDDELSRLEDDPTLLAMRTARVRCHWSDPGEVIAELGEILDVYAIVHDGTWLWAGGHDEHGGAEPGNVLVLDPVTGDIVQTFETEPYRADVITTDGIASWVAAQDGDTIQRIDTGDGTVGDPKLLTDRSIGDLELTADALWATDNVAGSLLRLDPENGELLDEVSIGPGDWYSSDLATAAGWLWLTNREDVVVRQLDPVTGELVAEHAVDSEYTMYLIDLGDAVGIYGSSELWRIEPDGDPPELIMDSYGAERIDVDAAVAVGDLVALTQRDFSTLAVVDPGLEFVEEMHPFDGEVFDERDQIASDGTDIWLATVGNRIVRIGR
jgi:hypothetical protein